jgi:hypothetical protein
MPKDLTKDMPSASPEVKAAYDGAKQEMIDIENNKRFLKRLTKGDASETGLVRWVTPLLM